MRTVRAPLSREVEQDLTALDAQLAKIAKSHVERLTTEPELGELVAKGRLASSGCRRVYFDRCRAVRRGDEPVSAGPKYRVVYWVKEAPKSGLRVIVVLAVGEAHPKPGQPSVYVQATARLMQLTRGR